MAVTVNESLKLYYPLSLSIVPLPEISNFKLYKSSFKSSFSFLLQLKKIIIKKRRKKNFIYYKYKYNHQIVLNCNQV